MPWRLLALSQQALLVLVHLRKGETFAELACGFNIGTVIAWRYVHEIPRLLSQHTTSLDAALRHVNRLGLGLLPCWRPP